MTAFAGFTKLVMKIVKSKFGLIFIMIIFSLIVAFFIVDDFGLSWDEYKDISYGEAALKGYQGDDDFLWRGGNRKVYGPFYWMMVSLITSFIQSLGIEVLFVDVWKYVGFCVFQMALFSFYILCTRFMKKSVALLTTLIFTTQPLLIGHAFMNAKDIPFMSFFMTSFVIGLVGVDAFQKRVEAKEVRSPIERDSIRDIWKTFESNWRGYGSTKRVAILGLIVLLILTIFDLFVAHYVILPWMQSIVRGAYDGTAVGSIQWIFEHIAQDAHKTPLDMYLEKLTDAYEWGRFFVVFGLLLGGPLLWSKIFAKERPKLKVAEWLRGHYVILLAGIMLGLTTSIRVAAPFVGVLVSLYFLVRSRYRAIIPLAIYWGIAIIITYATWPYLWGSPYDHFVESVNTSASFIQRNTLFQGEIIESTSMPWYYLPWLMVVQFTEPMILLGIIGIVIGIIAFQQPQFRRPEFLLLLLWAVLPAALIILLRIPVYDNFRQLFFIIPPFVVFSGIGLSLFLRKSIHRILSLATVLIVLVPGMVSIVTLHPYEYIYYNSFVGGVDGAYEHYELDYWCTSLRETINYVNQIAPPNSAIYIEGPITAAIPFVRYDLKINDKSISRDELDYAIACRYALRRDDYYADFETIFEVRRGEGILSLLKIQR